MTGQGSIRKSLWEHAGYPGVPNYRAEQSTEDVDQMFKVHINRLHEERVETVERVEAVFAWSVLREEDLRGRLRYYYDYELLNQSTNREAGPAELLEYHEQVDRIREELAADAAEMLANGASKRRAEFMQNHQMRKRHDEETSLRRPALPGAEETWKVPHAGLKAAGLGAVWAAVTAGLVLVAHVLGFTGPIAGALLTSPALAVTAAAVGWFGSAIGTYVRFTPRLSSQNRWLGSDPRGNWPLFVWALLAISVAVAFPVWATALWVPVSAAIPLLIPKFRKRLLESVSGAAGHMLEPRELLGRPAQYGPNVFAPPNSTIQAEGPAADVSMPVRSRDGSAGHNIKGIQDTLLNLAEHCGVEESGLTSDVHKVTAALLLDVVVGATGADDLRLVAQYGSGPMRLVARAVSIGMGQELILTESAPAQVKPGRAVADWYEAESNAYREFALRHLSEEDARLALTMAAAVASEAREYDFPHLTLYRLETLVYALSDAGAAVRS